MARRAPVSWSMATVARPALGSADTITWGTSGWTAITASTAARMGASTITPSMWLSRSRSSDARISSGSVRSSVTRCTACPAVCAAASMANSVCEGP